MTQLDSHCLPSTFKSFPWRLPFGYATTSYYEKPILPPTQFQILWVDTIQTEYTWYSISHARVPYHCIFYRSPPITQVWCTIQSSILLHAILIMAFATFYLLIPLETSPLSFRFDLGWILFFKGNEYLEIVSSKKR